jgi:hypothetical protein
MGEGVNLINNGHFGSNELSVTKPNNQALCKTVSASGLNSMCYSYQLKLGTLESQGHETIPDKLIRSWYSGTTANCCMGFLLKFLL